MCWELPTWNMSVAGLEISFQGAEAVSLQLDSLSSMFIRIVRGRVTELQQSCNRAATDYVALYSHCEWHGHERVKKKKSETLFAGYTVCELKRSTHHLNLSK
jgi:hypothetical protein